MLKAWRKKVSVDQLAIRHKNPIIFVLCQWQTKVKPNLIYLLYRWSMAVFFTISLLLSVANVPNSGKSAEYYVKWLIYLTNWGFTMCTVQSLLAAVMISCYFLQARKIDSESANQKNYISKIYKSYWIVNIIATDAALGITIIYWTLVYDETKMALDGMNFVVHVVNSILMLLDLCAVAHPVRFLHFYCPVIFGACYIVFSIIYYLAGGSDRSNGTAIYPILDWSKPGKTTGVCIVVMLFLIVLHGVTYGLYRLRSKIFNRLLLIREANENGNVQQYSHDNLALGDII